MAVPNLAVPSQSPAPPPHSQLHAKRPFLQEIISRHADEVVEPLEQVLSHTLRSYLEALKSLTILPAPQARLLGPGLEVAGGRADDAGQALSLCLRWLLQETATWWQTAGEALWT
jgi:hypothetical protein